MPKKIGIFLLCFVVLLSGCSSSKKTVQKEEPEQELTQYQQDFNEFLKEQLVETLESDYYTLHSYLKEPESYGIGREDIRSYGCKQHGRRSKRDSGNNRSLTVF